MNGRKQTAESRRLHEITRRIVILAAPPFDELNLVGVFQVFGTANQLSPGYARPYRIQVASAGPESLMTGYSGLSISPHLYYRDEERWRALSNRSSMIQDRLDRKSTRLNSSHQITSYAV